ncbi:APC family permease [Paraburkholderia sp. EG285A]|uniref:APC family permease n=1 Tax=Paraburkholderia sp. EG285A TaxID=3237009 RepID=UPI0034D2D8AF
MENVSTQHFDDHETAAPVRDDVGGEALGLRRTLDVADLVIFGMVYMLPIAPFALYGMIDKASNGMVPFVYVLSVLAMAFTAHSYQAMSREFPVAGSAYVYALNGLGAFAGFFAGWMVFLDYVIIPGLLAVISGAAMNSLFPEVPRWVWILGFVGIGTILNLVGVSVTARANKLFLCLMLLVLVIFLGAGGWALHEGKGQGALTVSAFFNPRTFTWAQIGTGVLLGSSNFLGFDAITTLGEEVRQGQRHLLGFAGMATLAIIAVLSVAQTWVAADLASGARIFSADTAFYDIARYAGGNWLFCLTSISTALAFGIPCTIVCQMGVTRIIYAMGRDRYLPHVLSRLSPRSRQPWVANLFVAAVTLVLALEFQDRLDDIALFQNFGALTAFMLVNMSVIGYFLFKKRSRRLCTHLILPSIALVIVVALMSAMRLATIELGGAWIAAGFVYYWVSRRVLGKAPAIQI